jgi:predicted nucleic acid-binding protein
MAARSFVIVVDTTVWVDFLRGRGTRFDAHLAELIEAEAPIALTDIIYAEVLQGVRDDAVHRELRAVLRAHPILRPRGLGTFDDAVTLYRTARRRGLTIRRTVDCVIAATVLENGAELFHNDRDFETLARVSSLPIYRFI